MLSVRVVAKLTESFHEINRRRRHQSSAQKPEVTEPSIAVTEDRRTLPSSSSIQEGLSSVRLPLVYMLCKQWAWPAIAFRCDTHPHEVSVAVVDERGDTALHWAVFGKPPIGAIQALIEACPALVSTKNRSGMLPIHVAASYRASGDVVRALVQAYPEGAGIPVPGKNTCALHLMCDYGASLDSLRAVLESDAGVASLQTKDNIFQATPLRILNLRKSMHEFHNTVSNIRKIRQKQEALREAISIKHAKVKDSLEALEQQLEIFRKDEFWQKASLLISTEYTNAIVHKDTDCQREILNACTSLWDQCPASLTELALLLYPEQLLQRDSQGRLPLHNAAQGSDITVLLDLLRTCPGAAKFRDARGCFPVQLAIQSGRGWNDGVRQILRANVEALEVMDLHDHLYPRIWQKLQQDENANALFESIRAKPNLLALAR